MEDFFDSLFRGNVIEVKVLLATILLGLATSGADGRRVLKARSADARAETRIVGA